MDTISLDSPENVVVLKTPFKSPVPDERFLVIDTKQCTHHNGPFLIDDSLSEVTCGRCTAKLNPMFVLRQLAQQESRWHQHFSRYQGEMQRLNARNKTKCQHCHKMTRISHA